MNRMLFLLTLIAIQPTIADEVEDCYQTAMTQMELNICAGNKNQEVEVLLEILLNELKDKLPPEPEKYLVKSQAAWLSVVENDCEIQSWLMDGGSARPMVVAGCYAMHSSERIKMLIPLLCPAMISTCPAKEKYGKAL